MNLSHLKAEKGESERGGEGEGDKKTKQTGRSFPGSRRHLNFPGQSEEEPKTWVSRRRLGVGCLISAPLSTLTPAESGDSRKSTCFSLSLTEPVLRGSQGPPHSAAVVGATLYL